MASTGDDQFRLLNDLPVDEADHDLLGAAPAAARLAALLHGSRGSTPFVLAIDGHWGAGKSTMMRQVAQALRAAGDVEVVWFNAWTASGADVLTGLLKLVLDRLDPNVVRRAARTLAGGGLLSGGLRVGATALAGVFRADRALDDLWERMAVDAAAREDARKLLASAIADWTQPRGVPRRTVAVFVDDLDRCGDATAIAICEAVKLYLDLPGVVFVLGCDLAVLSRVPVPGADGAGHVRQYLEKIIQVTYRLPPPSTEGVRRMIDGYAERSGTADLFDAGLVARQSRGNPRRVKRLINSFVAEYALDEGWAAYGPDALMRAVVMQHLYPDLYQEILRTDDDVLGVVIELSWLRERLRRGKVEPDEVDKVVSLLRMFGGTEPDAWEGGALDRALERLDARLPTSLLALTQDADCVAFVLEFRDEDARESLQRRLRSQPLSTAPSAPADDGWQVSLDGLRVLWVDDNPAGNDYLAETLRGRGALVEMAVDADAAVRLVRSFAPDALISDVVRDGTPVGFADLETIRKAGYRGPVLFYTGRVTPGFASQAEAAGATITTSLSDVLTFVAAAAAARATPRPGSRSSEPAGP